MHSIDTFGIIGGGEFGRVAAEHLAPPGADLLMFDHSQAVELPKNVTGADLATTANSDVVVLAVPFDAYDPLVSDVASLVARRTLIVDVCSVKTKPASFFADHGLLDRDNVLMTHPLFGPQSTEQGVAGKSIVVTEGHGEYTEQLLASWHERDINTIEMSAEDHDREMAKVHVLPFIIGRSLLEMGITESPLTTNYFGKLLALIDVERHHSPELFNTIQQHNPYAANIRSELIATMAALHAQVVVDAADTLEGLEPMDQLNEYRAILDVLDGYRDILLGLRFNITERVGILKANNDMPSADPIREQAQRQKRHDDAVRLGIPAGLAAIIHSSTHDAVIRQHDAHKANGDRK